MEKRFSTIKSDLKTRNEGEQKVLEGYFIVFNQETELWPGIFEEIAPSAVTNSLEKNDICALFNHDTGKVLGRIGNQTLELRADEHGLWGRVLINEKDREANDIYARVERGDIKECSFGFFVIDEEIQRDVDNDTTKFVIKDADILEVSIVTWGAYSTAEISARNRVTQVEQIKSNEERVRKARIQKLREKYGRES